MTGRHKVLSSARNIIDLAARGTFQFLAIAGEPGMGKTRLLGELAASARGKGMTVSSCQVVESAAAMPLSMIIDSLGDLVETRRHELDAAQAQLLARVFPDLGVTAGATGADPDHLNRYRQFRALRQLINALAASQGLALILDDVHLADDGSIEFVDHLVRHPPPGPLLIAIAYRPAQAFPCLAPLLSRHSPQSSTVILDPLSREEAESFFDAGADRTRREALYEASGGNPFHLEALAHMSLRDTADLPPRVRAAVQEELNHLTPTALLVAQAAAVAAEEFDPSLAAVIAEVAEPSTLAALDELVRRDIVRPASASLFRFRHALVRQAVEESSTTSWRMVAHARVAAHLAAIDAPAVRQAHHVERAGSFGDPNAIETLLSAARATMATAPAAAARWLQTALDRMPDSPETFERRLDIRMALSRAQSLGGKPIRGRETARKTLRLLRSDDYVRRARTVSLWALAERQLNRPHEARSLLLEELRRMPASSATQATPLRRQLVVENMMRADFHAAWTALESMAKLSDDSEPGVALTVATLRPMTAYRTGRIQDALRYAHVADCMIAEATDEDLAHSLDAIVWACFAETAMGRYSLAVRHFTRAIGVARTSGPAYVLTELLAGYAQALTPLGRLSEALAVAAECVEGARSSGSRQQRVVALAQHCLAATWSGDHRTALRAGEEGVRANVGGEEAWRAMAQHAHGVALINYGRLAEGTQALLDACDHFRAPRLSPEVVLSCAELLAQAAADLGRPDEATARADQADTLVDAALPVFSGFVPLARAHALRLMDPAAAAEHAVKAADLLIAGRRRIDAGRALLAAGGAQREAGEPERARESLSEARNIFESCGARAFEARAIREQRQLGVRVPRVPPRPEAGTRRPHGLSPRELEVAMLVAEGLTNHHIAKQLSLSIRTVETHLSHVFAKLGVSSRVVVATMLNGES